MSQSILVAYQFGNGPQFGLSYGRYVAGDPLAENLKPADVLSGKAIQIIREARVRADDHGELLGYRQIFGMPGRDLLTAIGAKAVPELVPHGIHILDLRHEPSRKLKWDINRKIRDELGPDRLPDLVDYGAYVQEENNSPWIKGFNPDGSDGAFSFPPDLLVEDLEQMAKIWGSRLCVNLSGASYDVRPMIERAGQLTDSSGEYVIQFVRGDMLGRNDAKRLGESWASLYRQRREYFGRDWLGATLEVNGHDGQWPQLGVDIPAAYQTFHMANGAFFASMGGTKCTTYPGWADFEKAAAARAATAVPALLMRIGKTSIPPAGDGNGQEPGGGSSNGSGGGGGDGAPDELARLRSDHDALKARVEELETWRASNTFVGVVK